MRLIVGVIHSATSLCHELKRLIEGLALLAIGLWGFLHVVQVLFGKPR